MSRLEQLYQEMILSHNKSPKNFGQLSGASHCSHGVNPLCGDDYWVYLNIADDGVIQKVMFDGVGCAISKASGSLMTMAIEGKKIEDVLGIKDAFLELVTTDCSEECRKKLGSLRVFEGVQQFPVRVKCATLVWRALEDAIKTT